MTASTPTKRLTPRQRACLWFALAMLANGLGFVSLFRGVNTAIAGGATCLLWVATYACLQRAWACWDAAQSPNAPVAPSAPAKETA